MRPLENSLAIWKKSQKDKKDSAAAAKKKASSEKSNDNEDKSETSEKKDEEGQNDNAAEAGDDNKENDAWWNLKTYLLSRLTGTGSETHFHNEIMMVMGDGCVSAPRPDLMVMLDLTLTRIVMILGIFHSKRI